MGGWAEHPPGLWVQVLGREGPFPLILLPQFGGYWIEGTNHQLSGTPESPQTPAPSTRAKLEGNHTAKIYRKHFLGKVRSHGCFRRGWVPHGHGWAWRPHKWVLMDVGAQWNGWLCVWVLIGVGVGIYG